MGNRYADDIKRIVGIDENQSTLGPGTERPSLPGRRGIGFINTQGQASGVSGGVGQTQISDVDGTNVTDSGQNQAGTTGLSPNDPQNGVIQSDTGVFDAADIIDGTSDGSKVSTPQDLDIGLGYGNDGAINAINAVDCDSGDSMEIRLRNEFTPPDATFDDNGNELTSDWDDAETPPVLAGYVQGTYWSISGSGGSAEAPAPYSAIVSANSNLNSSGPDAPYVFTRYEFVSGNNYNVYYTGFSTAEINLPMTSVSCSGSPPGDPASCPAEPPTEEAWPVDDAYKIKLDGGQFVTSQYDSEVPAKYSETSGQVDFCFGAGGSRQGTVEVTKNNGHMIYETSMGAPTGIIRAYDNSGRLVAAFDSASGWIDNYRP